MSIWSGLSRLLTVDDKVMDEDFSLGNRHQGSNGEDEGEIGQDEQKEPSSSEEEQPSTPIQGSDPLPESLKEMIAGLKTLFHMPDNKDIVIREFWTNTLSEGKGCIVFVDGMADKTIINNFILEPLLFLSRMSETGFEQTDIDSVMERLVAGNQVTKVTTWKDLTAGILTGSTAVLVDGSAAGLIVETKGWEHRSVGMPQAEPVIQGPHDSFNENFRGNTALVRTRVRSKDLVTEMLSLGEITRTDIAVMYMHGVANPRLVEEVKRRIKSLKLDFIQDSGVLMQMIEDGPFSFVPKLMGTERPDRVAAKVMEGHVAIFVGHSPFVLIAPTLFWSLLQTTEDVYLKFPYGAVTRLIRLFSVFVAVLLPAFYIAVTNYHPEMIPSDLAFAITASREKVPFPSVVEVLLMEFSIELIREAGIRIPSVIGPTIGIVGALILGQAAVTAGIVSPLLVITVAVTALASFALPNYNFSFSSRLLRFLFLVVAAMYGFYGICLGVMAFSIHVVGLKSFGVPILSPYSPTGGTSAGVIWQAPPYKQNERPYGLRTVRKKRQSDRVRKWDVRTTNQEEDTQ